MGMRDGLLEIVLTALVVGMFWIFWPEKSLTIREVREERISVCKFKPADMVVSKIGGYKGQVISRSKIVGEAECYSTVRFAGEQMTTDTRLIASDGTISSSPLMVIKYMRSYELEHWEG